MDKDHEEHVTSKNLLIFNELLSAVFQTHGLPLASFFHFIIKVIKADGVSYGISITPVDLVILFPRTNQELILFCRILTKLF